MGRRICGILALSLPIAVIGLSQQQNNHIVNGGSVSFGSLLTNSFDTSSELLVTKSENKARLSNWQYWCDSCACGFNKLKSYKEHNSGKLHLAVVGDSEIVWEEYMLSGPAFYDTSVSKTDVTRAWSINIFVEGLPARSRSSLRKTVSGHSSGAPGRGGQLDPNLMLRDLPPSKRASLWRYLRGVSPKLAGMVAVLPPQYARVKELLESAEAFSHVERLVKRSRSHGVKAKRISHVYDIGCGHGLVGMLCASAFPSMKIHSLDREPRESFQAQLEAFASSSSALDNLSFQAGDLSDLELVGGHKDGVNDEDGYCLLLCVHGCKSLTHESIELAIRKHWAWLAIPCCLQVEHHFDGTSLKVSDDTRFALLCGALALRHQAETVASIDPRITARGIVLSSSGVK